MVKKTIEIIISSLDDKFKPVKTLRSESIVLKRINYNKLEEIIRKEIKRMYYKLNKT